MGNVTTNAGLATPLIRPTINNPADIKAPVFPADTQPSASPDFTASAILTIELSFLRLIARTGSSSISIFSVQCLNSIRS